MKGHEAMRICLASFPPDEDFENFLEVWLRFNVRLCRSDIRVKAGSEVWGTYSNNDVVWKLAIFQFLCISTKYQSQSSMHHSFWDLETNSIASNRVVRWYILRTIHSNSCSLQIRVLITNVSFSNFNSSPSTSKSLAVFSDLMVWKLGSVVWDEFQTAISFCNCPFFSSFVSTQVPSPTWACTARIVWMKLFMFLIFSGRSMSW